MNYVFPVVACRDVIVINWEELYAVLAKIKNRKSWNFKFQNLLIRKPAKATGCRNYCVSFSAANGRFLPVFEISTTQVLLFTSASTSAERLCKSLFLFFYRFLTLFKRCYYFFLSFLCQTRSLTYHLRSFIP